jgi:hypothetical protein
VENESVCKRKLYQIVKIIRKYEFFLSGVSGWEQPADNENWESWLLGVASTEIEELLAPSYLRTNLAPLMFAWLKKNFVWDTETLSETDREIQLFIAAQRALAKSDNQILRYRLLLLLDTRWLSDSEKDWKIILSNLSDRALRIETFLNYSQSNLVFRFVKRYSPVFTVLNEVLKVSDNPEQILSNPELMEQRAREVIDSKYEKLQGQVRNAVVRSIIYLFVTKVLVALIIELPYEIMILKHLNVVPLLINIVLPPLFMLALGVSTGLPGEDNTKRILAQLKNLMYKSDEETEPLPAKLTLSLRQKRLSRYFSFFYSLVFMLIVVFIGWILLTWLNYNVVSVLLFFSFLSLVLLFGYRVRWEAQELTVAKQSGGVIGHMMSVLAMPFINLGAWLSAGLSQINIFMFLLDVLIDAPLKSIVSAVEEWSQFLQRKEEEVVEVPG